MAALHVGTQAVRYAPPVYLLLACLHCPAFGAQAVQPPQPRNSQGPELVVRGLPGAEEVWIFDQKELIRVDQRSGRVLTTVTQVKDPVSAFRAANPKTIFIDRWSQAWLAPLPDGRTELLYHSSNYLTRVHSDGSGNAVGRTQQVTSAAGLPDGGTAYVDGRGLTITGPIAVDGAEGDYCTLPGARGDVVAPDHVGDPVLLVDPWVGVLLIGPNCRPSGFLAIEAITAALTPDALWVVAHDDERGVALSRFPRPGASGEVISVGVAGATRSETCGDLPCFAFGALRWNPFTGETSAMPNPAADDPPQEPPERPYALVGATPRWRPGPNPRTDANRYALRRVPGGTQVVDLSSGHDIGVQIPRWPYDGVVSPDGKLALIVDRNGPPAGVSSPPKDGGDPDEPTDRTALFEVATGRELWSLPVLVRPESLTASAFLVHKLAATWLRMPEDDGLYLVDTRTGRDAYLLTRPGPEWHTQWLRAGLLHAGTWWSEHPTTETVPRVALGGASLPRWSPVRAPVPAEGALADDPLYRVLTDPLGGTNFDGDDATRTARLHELQVWLGTDDENPLTAFSPTGAWPAQALANRGASPPTEPLRPGRQVPALSGFLDRRTPLHVPLQTGRPTLVVLGPSALIGPRLATTGWDPDVDLIWATDEGDRARWPAGPGEHDAFSVLRGGQRRATLGDPMALATALGIPNPGAVLVGADGRVLAEGDLAKMEGLVQGRGLEGLQLPQPRAPDWAYAGPEVVTSVAGLADGGVAFVTAHHVGALDRDGRLRWVQVTSAVAVHASGDRVITSGAFAWDTAYDARSGTALWELAGSGGIQATGSDWALAEQGGPSRLYRLDDGAPGSELRGVVQPQGGRGLSMAVADGWRCAVEQTGAILSRSWGDCWPGHRALGLLLTTSDGALAARTDDGSARWTQAGVVELRILGDVVLVQLGGILGPWATLTADGKLAAQFASDVEPSPAPGVVFGVVDGAVVAWGTP